MQKILKNICMYKKSCTFVLGLSKEVLSPINLLVISFSVINYVVRVRVHAGCVDAHFFVFSPTLIHGKGSSGGQTGQDRTAIHGKGSFGGLTGASPGGQCLGLAATLAQPPDYS